MANGAFGDPVLYVDFLFEKRALLFDAGNLRSLATRKLLRITDVMISHRHMDHFADLDWLFRFFVGRPKTLRIYGPDGIIKSVSQKLRAYSWNLVENYSDDFVVIVTEIPSASVADQEVFRCRTGFRSESRERLDIDNGAIIDESNFCIRGKIFDHGIPSIGYCLHERQHVNIWKNRLQERQLAVGPWLRELKRAVTEGKPDDTPIRVLRQNGGGEAERLMPLGDLKKQVLKIVPGQKIGFLVDVVDSEQNREMAVELYQGCDLFFVEAAFLEKHSDIAARRRHLTARQAGSIAKAAGVGRLIPIHFSPRYADCEQLLRAEAEAAYRS